MWLIVLNESHSCSADCSFDWQVLINVDEASKISWDERKCAFIFTKIPFHKAFNWRKRSSRSRSLDQIDPTCKFSSSRAYTQCFSSTSYGKRSWLAGCDVCKSSLLHYYYYYSYIFLLFLYRNSLHSLVDQSSEGGSQLKRRRLLNPEVHERIAAEVSFYCSPCYSAVSHRNAIRISHQK